MRHSDDSDDSSYRRSKKKKSKRSRSKSREKKRRSRSRSRNRTRRSRSRDKRSRSKDKRSRSRDRKSRDKRSRSKDRRSREKKKSSRHSRSRSNSRPRKRSRSRRRSTSRSRQSPVRSRRSRSRGRKSKSRSPSKPKAYKSRTPSSSPDARKQELNLTIAEELKRQKQIEEIDSDSFVQASFRTEVNYTGRGVREEVDEGEFKFGTSAEINNKQEIKAKLEQLNSEGLLNPDLFGNQDFDSALKKDLEEIEDEDPVEAERRRKEADEERKRKLITEIAINWEASREESERKHKALALLIEAKEEEKIMKQELAQKRWGKKEGEGKGGGEGEGEKEKEENTWKQRWFQDYKTKQVYTSSKILSKTKQKMKLLEKEKERKREEEADAEEEEKKEAAEAAEPQGVIGSIQEYASLVGKSVKQLAEAKYDLPEVSDSESEDSGGDEDGNLWGTILGGGD